VAVQAFVDDSGTKGTDRVFVLAGFIGPAEQWAVFSGRWKAWLDSPPSIKYLKMNEAVKLKGEFRGWKPAERDKKLAGGVEIIKQFPLRAIHVTIDLEAFEKNWSPHLAKPMNSPYFMGCYTILSGICYDQLDLEVSDPVEVIFDNHVIFAPRINLWYRLIREAWETIYDSALKAVLPSAPRFEDDKQFVPLQASDILAWLFRMAFSGRRNRFEWIAGELSPLIPMSTYASVFSADRMNRIAALSYKQKFSPETVKRWKEKLASR